jgi:hypothetical protein
VSDLLALERCICQTVGQQSKADEVKASAEATELPPVGDHAPPAYCWLDNQLKMLGSDPTVMPRKLWAQTGLVAGTIEKFRSHALSRMLRDDHTALSHATLGYTALHSAALMLKNNSAADLAFEAFTKSDPICRRN